MSSTKAGNFESLKQTLSKVSRSMYKADLAYNSIILLEKSAINGRNLEKKEAVLKKKDQRPLTPLENLMKHHHKISDGVQIYQLPKLPFGSHQSYNEEKNFIEDHFNYEAQSNLPKNLEVFRRKFRLIEKTQAKSSKNYKKKIKKSIDSNFYSFKTKTGFLYCPVENSITTIYENDKAQYDDQKMQQTKRDLDNPDPNSIPTSKCESNRSRLSQIPQISKKLEKDLINRLHPAQTEPPIIRYYSTKYPQLFEKESQIRPHSSLSTHPWNNFGKREYF